MLAMIVRRPNAEGMRPTARERPAAGRSGAPGPDELETMRLRILGNAQALAQMREQKPELAAAVHDPARFREVWLGIYRDEEERQRERQNQIALLNEDPFNVEAQRKIEEMIRQDRVMDNLQHAYEHNPEGKF